MLPIYPASTIRKWDEFTIKNKSIESLELMEWAAMACVNWITKNISLKNPVSIFCGNGNNGGDGLAIARLLFHSNYEIKVYINEESPKRSWDNVTNLEKLRINGFTEIIPINKNGKIDFPKGTIIMDCIFGTGLDRPVEGFWKNVIASMNVSECRIISIDMPSGLVSEPSDDNTPKSSDVIVKANTTLTFQTPKLSMLLPGWGNYCGKMEILDIGLSPEFIDKNQINYFFTTLDFVKEKFKKREVFTHKGTYGHALIIAGNTGKCGAAILSSKACIKSGAGLVTVHNNQDCSAPIHTAIPEVMINSDTKTLDLKNYSAICIGPGIGTDAKQVLLLKSVLKNSKCPLLLDADALTILSQNDILIPANTILTPHPKEFDRLAGTSKNAFERLEKAQKFAKEKNCIMVLKGAYTAICSPDGNIYFNSTGNAGMATAGSGDVLSGIITSFLAQGYSPIDAAIIGVFVHGEAGDEAANKKSITGLIASDIIENLNSVFKRLENF